MLEFIVLGQIPGTNIQIGFSGALIIAASILTSYVLAQVMVRSLRRHKRQPVATTAYINLEDLAL